MNWLKRGVFFCFCLVVISSCDNDFDLIEGNVDVPVIYGLLSAQDTAHYIRVEKAFVDENISGTALAQDPANLYYEDVEVQLTHIPSGQVFSLEKVDGNLEGYVREPGAFAQAPNTLYKIRNSEINFVEEEEYQLSVNIPGEETITSSTFIIEPTFPSSPGAEAAEIAFFEDKSISFTWTPGNLSFLTSCKMNISYIEQVGSETEIKELEWNLFNNVDTRTYRIDKNAFFTFLGNNIEADPQINRIFLNIDIYYYGGGEEIKDYLTVSNANLGITSSGDVPVYSNLSRGRGIFSSRSATVIENVQLTRDTEELLKTNPLTADLNFQ
jgi:hypothetical protein